MAYVLGSKIAQHHILKKHDLNFLSEQSKIFLFLDETDSRGFRNFRFRNYVTSMICVLNRLGII